MSTDEWAEAYSKLTTGVEAAFAAGFTDEEIQDAIASRPEPLGQPARVHCPPHPSRPVGVNVTDRDSTAAFAHERHLEATGSQGAWVCSCGWRSSASGPPLPVGTTDREWEEHLASVALPVASDSTAASVLQERLREAARRWSPGVDFGPDLLREAADALDEQSEDARPTETHVGGGPKRPKKANT